MTTSSGELQGGASRVRPLRVAMVGNASTIHSIVRGGAIAAMGHHVRLVTLGPPLATTDFEVRTRPIPRSVLAGLLAFRSFQRDLREFHPDILHVHYAGGRLGSLALASGIKPLVVTVMGGDVQPEQHMGQLGLLDRRATRRLLGESALILAKSQLLADKVALLGDYAGKTEVVRWGIDLERFRHDEARGQALRERLKLGPGPVLLSPRVLRPLYNIQLIVDAMPAILQTCSGAQLLISRLREDPKYTERVRNRVLELGLSGQVHFIEAFDYESMPALLSLTDVVISVPFSDGLPQTLFESLASETPIVLGRLPAYLELVADEREVLLTDLEAPALAETVSRLLKDDGLARRLCAAGLQRVRKTASLPEQARRVAELYEKVLARERGASPLGPRILDALSLPLAGGGLNP